MSVETVVAAVEGEVKKVEAEAVKVEHAVVADAKVVVTKVEYVAKEVYDALAAEVAKLRADFEALVARIEKHNSSGTPFPVK